MPRPSQKVMVLIAFLLLVYLIAGCIIIFASSQYITDEYYALVGTKAKDIAVITANKLALTDGEVERLKALNFDQLPSDPVNVLFTSFFANRDDSSDLKYAYVMLRLPESEIKYYVTEENAAFYELDAGTPLDAMWLLDVVLGEKEQKTAAEQIDYYQDSNRYTSLRSGPDAELYERRVPGYSMVKDEWGEYVSGLTPLYTREGTFAGMLGVDIYAENLRQYRNKILLISFALFLVPSIILSMLLLIVYANYVKVYRQSSITDELSSLYNRAYLSYVFPLVLKNCARHKYPLTVIMLDIDYFKNYNDRYGHQSGDEVIRKIGSLLGDSTLRSSDVVVRYGGEEFILLCQDMDSAGALTVAERIRKSVLELAVPHAASGCAEYVTVSQGIYCAVPDGDLQKCEKKFIRQADYALYAAKAAGRNCFKIITEIGRGESFF